MTNRMQRRSKSPAQSQNQAMDFNQIVAAILEEEKSGLIVETIRNVVRREIMGGSLPAEVEQKVMALLHPPVIIKPTEPLIVIAD